MLKYILTFLFFLSVSTSPVLAQTDRTPAIKDYMLEFVNSEIITSYPKIRQALENVLFKLPDDVFMAVTNRERPVIFINTVSSGIARYARSNEFTVEENDPPALRQGFYLITLSDELNTAGNSQAIEGIIFHEIAHRYLEHLRSEKYSCAMELEANHLVQEWGFDGEFQSAKQIFGSKKTGDSPCKDWYDQLTDEEKEKFK